MPSRATGYPTLVTVTYGKRWYLLQSVLDSAFACGIQRCIVVNNGSRENLIELCSRRYGTSVRIVDLGFNTGSAGGYRAGIKAAIDELAEFLMLVDDDNALAAGTVDKLMDAHCRELSETKDQLLVMVGFRPERQIEVASGQKRSVLHKNAFLGFHLKHFWQKAHRVVGKPIKPRTADLPELAVLDFAPYGGMLFHRDLIAAIGLPNPDFVLYADDTEYSYRVTKLGGRLLLVTGARIVDLQSSWNATSRHKSVFHSWINGESDQAVFYAARNRSCFENNYVTHNKLIRTANRFAFFCALALIALSEGNWNRFLLMRLAVLDGECNRLGIRPGLELS